MASCLPTDLAHSVGCGDPTAPLNDLMENKQQSNAAAEAEKKYLFKPRFPTLFSELEHATDIVDVHGMVKFGVGMCVAGIWPG